MWMLVANHNTNLSIHLPTYLPLSLPLCLPLLSMGRQVVLIMNALVQRFDHRISSDERTVTDGRTSCGHSHGQQSAVVKIEKKELIKLRIMNTYFWNSKKKTCVFIIRSFIRYRTKIGLSIPIPTPTPTPTPTHQWYQGSVGVGYGLPGFWCHSFLNMLLIYIFMDMSLTIYG